MSQNDGSQYDDFFDGVGGGAPSFKFSKDIGDIVSGVIEDQFRTQQTAFGDPNTKLFFEDGSPRMQLNVTLQTNLRNWDRVTKVPEVDGVPKPASEDDGKRRIYIKSDMQRAVGVAIREATGTKGGLRNGGKLAVKLTGFKDTGKGNPLPLYEARYQPPAEGADFFDQGAAQQPQQPAQAPAQQPQAAPPAPTPPPAAQAPAEDPWATAPASAPSTSGWADEPPF